MHNRMPSRRRQSSGKQPPRAGVNRTMQGEKQEAVPRMPHERDESSDSQAPSEPSGREVGQAAREDIERGLTDTDKGPVLEETYDKLRAGADDPLKKLAP